jgi:hypothetical protein
MTNRLNPQDTNQDEENGTMAAWFAEQAQSSLALCSYCNTEVPNEGDYIPDEWDDAEWARLRELHAADCEWAETRSHRIDEQAVFDRLDAMIERSRANSEGWS